MSVHHQSASEIIENEERQGSTSAANPPILRSFLPLSSEQIGHREAAAEVIYDYIFKKQLTATDATTKIAIPLAEAERHFSPLQLRPASKRTPVRFYDIDCQKTRETALVRYYNLYCFTMNWPEYVTDNRLQKGDTVLFYKMGISQSENNELAPPYAVQIERSWASKGTDEVHISLDELVTGKKSGYRLDGHEEAAEVKYDYVFKKQLTFNDVKRKIILPKAVAKKYCRLKDVPNPAMVQVYDMNREQTTKWKLVLNSRSHFFTGNWTEYVNDNDLQKGDSVLFYKTARYQSENELPPPYAVQIEKSGTSVETGEVYIPLDKLAV